MKYAVFTVMVPEWDLEEAARNLAQLGYDGVEWRVQRVPDEIPEGTPISYWGYNRATVDLKRVVELAPQVKQISEEAGLEICSLTSYLQVAQAEEIERVMQAAQIMGCPRMRVNVPRYDRTRDYNDLFTETTEHLREVEKLARRHSIEANLEIHMGNIIPSAGLAHRLVSQFDPKLIGVIYDPGNMVHEGYENWRMGMELLGPYLHHVHAKNGAWERDETLEDGTVIWRCDHTPVREGVANWHEIMSDLKAVGYDGWLSFEDFSSEEPTWDKCRGNLAYLRAVEED
ncbi:MAG: sugar phosphate isomerase/epimerase [Chloroflexota bacterium]|nr:sugar phosphate isomerase/epimerase [Chloroflexota bacterium]